MTRFWNNLHQVYSTCQKRVMWSIADEGYSRNGSCGVYLMKVIPETGHVEHT
jgi:hypothetical protein